MSDYGSAWRILRLTSLTDQIFIKAQRIRSLQTKKENKIDEGQESEFIGIINYSVMALIQIEKIVNKYIDSISLLGSSMGGFLGTYLVEKYSIKGAFVNPAVNPSRGLSNYIGQNRNYLSDETWVFKKHHISEYKEVTCKKIMKHGQYLILLETGDEVLNYKDAVQFYNGASIIIVQGGEHRFVSYEKYLPKIYDFLFS